MCARPARPWICSPSSTRRPSPRPCRPTRPPGADSRPLGAGLGSPFGLRVRSRGYREQVTSSSRQPSLAGRLARLGFVDPPRAQRLLADPALAGLVDPLEDVFDDGVLSALGEVPDPDLALLGLVRLLEGLRRPRGD